MESRKHKFSKSIHEMELHEELVADALTDTLPGGSEFEGLPLRVIRVSGGWLYYNVYATPGGIFVPFSDEFKKSTCHIFNPEWFLHT